MKSPDMSKVNKSPPATTIPRSSSQPQRVNATTSPPSSCCDAAPGSPSSTSRGRTRRSQLGQSMSVDNDQEQLLSPTGGSLPPPEIIISGRDDHQHPVVTLSDDLQQQQRKGSASSEGSCSGRKSPRERLVQKMSRVFK